MANQAVKTQGTTLEIEELPLGSASWVAIGDVKSIGASGGQAPEIDVTNLGSTAKEFILGLADNGTIPLGLNWAGVGNDSGQEDILDRFGDSSAANFRITFSNAHTMTFQALVQTFDVSVEPDAAVDLAVGLRITGARTFSPGGSFVVAGMDVTYNGANPAATVEVAADGFYLTDTASGAQSVLWADQATISAVETAISALTGWTASLDAGQDPSAASSTFDVTASQVIVQAQTINFSR